MSVEDTLLAQPLMKRSGSTRFVWFARGDNLHVNVWSKSCLHEQLSQDVTTSNFVTRLDAKLI